MPAHAIAAVVYKPTDNIETLLAHAARASPSVASASAACSSDIAVIEDPCAMQLENLETGESIPLSQELGRGSISCRVDRTRSHAARWQCAARSRVVSIW